MAKSEDTLDGSDDGDLDNDTGTLGGNNHEDDDEFEEVVIEEDDDDKDDKTRERGSDDERLGADADADEDEQRREARRKERKDKRAKKKRLDREDRLEIGFLRTRNDDLERRLVAMEENVNKRFARTDVNTLKGQKAALQSRLSEADEVIAAAVEAQNGADHVKALNIRDQIRDQMRRVDDLLETGRRQDEGGNDGDGDKRTAPKNDQRAVREVITRNATIFKGKHDWFDGKSKDSILTMGIDAQLRGEGMNPANASFWVELENRMKNQLPHRFNEETDDDEQDDTDDSGDDEGEERVQRQTTNGAGKKDAKGGNGARRGPPTPSGGAGPGKNGKTYVISRERREALQQAGMWDDPKMRAKMVKRYAAHDRELKAARTRGN